VRRAVDDLIALVASYCGGQTRQTILDAEHPTFDG
jgi:hypothetical protein